MFNLVKNTIAIKAAIENAPYRDRTNSQYYPDYLSIFRGKGCFSSVGCQYKGKQQLSLGYNCANDVGTPIHEIMHALGRTKMSDILSFQIKDCNLFIP